MALACFFFFYLFIPKVTPRTLRTNVTDLLPAGWRLVLGAAEQQGREGTEQSGGVQNTFPQGLAVIREGCCGSGRGEETKDRVLCFWTLRA